MGYHSETKWTLWRIVGFAVICVVLMGGLGFTLSSLGLFGRTVVERKVFENSYQRMEGLKAQIAQDEAVIAEIEAKLANPELDEGTRRNLEAQVMAARIRIETAKRRLGQ